MTSVGLDDEGLGYLAARLVAVAAETSVSLGLGESCTGGLVGAAITGVPGSSEVFAGSVVAYANGAKECLLGVPADMIAVHGAVSEPVAGAMAAGARRVFGVDWGAGVTGIAGPGGGSPDKPVGLVFVAVAGKNYNVVRRFLFSGNREEIRRASVKKTLLLLLEAVGGEEGSR